MCAHDDDFLPGGLARTDRRWRPSTWVPGVLWFILKIWFIFFLFAMVKAIVPRYRYDQLMRIGWKFFLPISLVWVVVTAGYLLAFDKLARVTP